MDDIEDADGPEDEELIISAEGSDDSATLRTELLRHLSSEIGKQSDYLLTLRSRMAYSVLIGPFVIVGAALIGFKDRQIQICALKGHWTFSEFIPVILSYVGLAVYGALLDGHATDQSNRWRDAILRLWQGESLSQDDLRYSHYHPFLAHVLAYGLVICAFGSIAWLVFQVMCPGP